MNKIEPPLNKKLKIHHYGIFLLFVMFTLVLPVPQQASAHTSRTFVNYEVEAGWDEEPVYTEIPNSVFISVNKKNDNTLEPVINALKNVQTSIKYGTVSKQIDFLPSAKEDGAYVSPILLTRVGSYVLVLKGIIEDQPVDIEIILDDVATKNILDFPPQDIPSNYDVSAIDDRTINSIANSIEETTRNSDYSFKTVSGMSKSLQESKDSLDMLYMENMTAIGVGISAIIIAVNAIRNKPKVQ